MNPNTPAEQAAGRMRLEQILRASVIEEGRKKLRDAFGDCVAECAYRYDDSTDQHLVDVVVHTEAGPIMQFTDVVNEFPSELIITKIALVASTPFPFI